MLNTIAVVAACLAAANVVLCREYVFNFNKDAQVDLWYEYSDIQRDGVGESKADFVLLESNITRKAVFFGIANSLNNEYGAARVMTEGFWDWSQHNNILINLRGSSTGGVHYLVLNHKGINQGPRTTRYRLAFETSSEAKTIELPLKLFEPPITEGAEDLETSHITAIGIAFDTTDVGQYLVSALEINWLAVA